MRKIFTALAVVSTLVLAGCQSGSFVDRITSTVTTVSEFSVPPESIRVASAAFNGVQVTAAAYLRLPICPRSAPVCRNPQHTETIASAVSRGRVAREELQAFLRRNPGKLGPKGAYDALVTATNTIKAIAGG